MSDHTGQSDHAAKAKRVIEETRKKAEEARIAADEAEQRTHRMKEEGERRLREVGEATLLECKKVLEEQVIVNSLHRYFDRKPPAVELHWNSVAFSQERCILGIEARPDGTFLTVGYQTAGKPAGFGTRGKTDDELRDVIWKYFHVQLGK